MPDSAREQHSLSRLGRLHGTFRVDDPRILVDARPLYVETLIGTVMN